MATLLFRLCGPMQSWGTRSRFSERDTELEPSKSGVVGLLCAALGRPRSESVDDLAALRLGIRVDHEGVMARDYHTAGAGTGIMRASGQVSKDAQLSNRYYLAGADFLVGVESPNLAQLESLEAALRAPVWQLSLGRKAFVPALPVYLPNSGIRQSGLEDALEQEPWPLPAPRGVSPWMPPREPRRLRLVLETSFGEAGHELRMDQPIGAAFQTRRFGPRPIVQRFTAEKEYSDVSQPVTA